MGNILCCMDDKKYDYENREGYKEPENPSDSLKSVHFHNTGQQSNESGVDDLRMYDDRQIGQENTNKSLADDNLEDYAYQGESDDEIEELSRLRNEWEDDIKFTKRGIRDKINSFIDFENGEDQSKLWDLKLDKEDCKVFIKKGGSERNKEQPFIKAQIVFNSQFSMKKIIESIYNVKHRLQWDKNVLKLELTPLMNQSNCFYSYQVNKGILNMNNRDFVDKQIKFATPEDDGKYYVYYSHIPNDTSVKVVPPRHDRAQTIVGMQRLERREDGKIIYQTFIQGDLKVKITPKLIAMFLPSGIQDWVKRCNKYIIDNYDKI